MCFWGIIQCKDAVLPVYEFHCGNKTIVLPSHNYIVISCTCKMASSYCIRALWSGPWACHCGNITVGWNPTTSTLSPLTAYRDLHLTRIWPEVGAHDRTMNTNQDIRPVTTDNNGKHHRPEDGLVSWECNESSSIAVVVLIAEICRWHCIFCEDRHTPHTHNNARVVIAKENLPLKSSPATFFNQS